jgi:predicted DNA-binding transcriptional regulator AlpA
MPRTVDVKGARLLTVNELAGRLGVSVRKCWRLVHTDDRFPRPVKVGIRGTRFREIDADKYVARLSDSR